MKLETGCSRTGSSDLFIWRPTLRVDCFHTWCGLNPRRQAVFVFFHIHERLFFWSTPELKHSFHVNDFILSASGPKISPEGIYFTFSQTVSFVVIRDARSFIPPALLRKNWRSWSPRKSQERQINLTISFNRFIPPKLYTSWTAVPLPFLLRWIVASCNLSWNPYVFLINRLHDKRILVVHNHHHSLSDASCSSSPDLDSYWTSTCHVLISLTSLHVRNNPKLFPTRVNFHHRL